MEYSPAKRSGSTAHLENVSLLLLRRILMSEVVARLLLLRRDLRVTAVSRRLLARPASRPARSAADWKNWLAHWRCPPIAIGVLAADAKP
jgi:hypothetical protein